MNNENIAGKQSANDVCAVIVTFHPDTQLPQRLCKEAGGIVIVDNHSEASVLPMLRESTRHLIVNDRNVGLATALNQGVRLAKELGYKYVVVFDQDSEPMPGLLPELLRVYEESSKQFKVAIVGSNFLNRGSSKPFHPESESGVQGWHATGEVLTTGSLIPTALFDQVGFFRDEFFIDGIDIEFALRARRHGYTIIQAHNILMRHSAGDPLPNRFFGRTVWTINHNPLRCYTITRNSIMLLIEYFFFDPIWAVRYSSHQLRWFIKLVLFESERLRKLKAVLLGMRDGFVRKGGIPSTL